MPALDQASARLRRVADRARASARRRAREALLARLHVAAPEPAVAAAETAQTGETGDATDILEAYCRDAPSPQTAVDIFAGEWASALPAPLQDVRAGGAPLFEIEHVPWGVELLGGVQGRRVVELGPLEGGHTYILDRLVLQPHLF